MDHDEIAEACSADNETNLLNGHYERPAILDLAGDVAGRRVLDAGCGSGPLAAALRERGAVVSGFDLSPAMLALARRRLGADVDLVVADLADPLPYPDSPRTPRRSWSRRTSGTAAGSSAFLFFVLEA